MPALHGLPAALRGLARSPAFCWVTVGIFAVGVGAAAILFSLVDTLLLQRARETARHVEPAVPLVGDGGPLGHRAPPDGWWRRWRSRRRPRPLVS